MALHRNRPSSCFFSIFFEADRHETAIHWGEDAAEFVPDRFIDTETYHWPREACKHLHPHPFPGFFNIAFTVMAFSEGPRACIGQRFAVAEATCIIAKLVRNFEVLVPEELQGKSMAEQRRALLAWAPGVTTVPTGARVRFRRRV